MEDTCNTQSDTSNTTVTVGPPGGPSVPYVRPSTADLHQDWPFDPIVRARQTDFEAMIEPGAMVTYTTRKGKKTVTRPVRPREAAGAMKVLTVMGRNALAQQRADYETQQHNNDMTLNDLVSPVMEVARPPTREEAKRQGLRFFHRTPGRDGPHDL